MVCREVWQMWLRSITYHGGRRIAMRAMVAAPAHQSAVCGGQ